MGESIYKSVDKRNRATSQGGQKVEVVGDDRSYSSFNQSENTSFNTIRFCVQILRRALMIAFMPLEGFSYS